MLATAAAAALLACAAPLPRALAAPVHGSTPKVPLPKRHIQVAAISADPICPFPKALPLRGPRRSRLVARMASEAGPGDEALRIVSYNIKGFGNGFTTAGKDSGGERLRLTLLV